MLAIFWLCTALIVYVYAAYPALLRLGALGGPQQRKRGLARFPLVSVIVPAHNEEISIGTKIDNLLSSGYPHECLEILIGSDGSSDRTEEVVRRYRGEGVGLVSFPQQHGKSAIQNGLVALASRDILVFTDADCTFTAGTLTRLIGNFADPMVGLVTARPHFENSSETSVTRNEGIYLRYETWLRKQESARGVLALASGSLFAMRRALWRPLNLAMGDDFELPLRVARAGFQNVLEPEAIAVTRLTQNEPRSMFRMKVRIIAKDLRALAAYRDLLDPLRHGGLAIALWSHKLLRWFVPYFLLALFASNVFLLHASFFRTVLAMQAAFYSFAAVGLVFRRAARRTIFSIPASFCVVNAAAFFGTLSCAFGRTFNRWTPARATVRAGGSPVESRGAGT